jgi:hypothetical protein
VLTFAGGLVGWLAVWTRVVVLGMVTALAVILL